MSAATGAKDTMNEISHLSAGLQIMSLRQRSELGMFEGMEGGGTRTSINPYKYSLRDWQVEGFSLEQDIGAHFSPRRRAPVFRGEANKISARALRRMETGENPSTFRRLQ